MQSKELRRELLKLYNEIADICKRNGIEFFAEGGTVIGALRHRGFIPWDDDIDLVMYRDEFNRFREAVDREKPTNRVLECIENNSEYPLVTIKYVNTENTDIFRSLMYDGIAGGVYIDIFVLDPVPREKEGWFKETFLTYAELLCTEYILSSNSPADKYIEALENAEKNGREKILEEYRQQLFNFSKEESDYLLVRWAIEYQLVRKEYYGTPRWLPFEDTLMPVPEKAEKILADFFGDDWYILPEEEDYQIHNVVRDLNRGYKEYKTDYMMFVNKDKLRNHNLQRKKIEIGNRDLFVRNSNIEYAAYQAYDSMCCRKSISTDELELSIKNGALYEALDILKPYIEAQSNGNYRRNGLELNVPEEIKEIAFRSLMDAGKYYVASKMLPAFMNSENAVIRQVEKEIEIIRDAIWEKNYGDKSKAIKILSGILENNPKNLSAYKYWIELQLSQKLMDADAQDGALEMLQMFFDNTHDKDVLKYMADLYVLNGNQELAKEYYNKAAEDNRNGLNLLEIEDSLRKMNT